MCLQIRTGTTQLRWAYWPKPTSGDSHCTTTRKDVSDVGKYSRSELARDYAGDVSFCASMPETLPSQNTAKPILKWAGGKTQLLGEIEARLPERFNRYVEPFFGGGAVFFHLASRLRHGAVIADSNPELVNLYQQVADNVEQVIGFLAHSKSDERTFYEIRELDWKSMVPAEAAARTIYLNKTCFNGLYRVNKKGAFNVPFGRNANPKICNPEGLRAASIALKKATILCADYQLVLQEHVKQGDLVFLDPPYLPISAYADFKRYTKEQFYEEDHRELAAEVERLHTIGAHVILTNSNHPLVHEVFGSHQISVISTRRNINKDGGKRRGEDIIVNVPAAAEHLVILPPPVPTQVAMYPATRFMGSKEKLLEAINNLSADLHVDTAVDLFAGSGVVGYLFKAQGRKVISNDFLAMSAEIGRALVENNTVTLSGEDIAALVENENPNGDGFVTANFRNIFFNKRDSEAIDNIRANIAELPSAVKRSLAITALVRACMKKQARGIFTYVGKRYDDGRRDIKLSIVDHFLEAAATVNKAVFTNGQANRVYWGDAMELPALTGQDGRVLVYIDPPYYTPKSDADYVRRYHFVEGIARNWDGVQIQQHSKVKKFKSYPTPFSTRNGAFDAFDTLFKKFREHILLVSYSSNSLPTKDELTGLMARYKSKVEVHEVDYRYHFGNQKKSVGKNRNNVKEYLFLGI